MKKSIVCTSVFVAALGITTLGVAGAKSGSAQEEKPKPPAQTEKGKSAEAKSHTMTGCLEKGPDANTFMLTNVEGTGPKTVELHADASKKLEAHVGHKVAITGPDMDAAAGSKGAPKSGAEQPKSSGAEHRMGVSSVKMISATCK
jgi:hypothetical protein